MLEDWHYLENTILLVANEMLWGGTNTFLGVFGNGYLRLSNLKGLKANNGPYSSNLCETGIKLLQKTEIQRTC